MTHNSNKKEQGFTLIELMIVVAIIGILAAIAIPQFATYRAKAFNAAALSDLNAARMAEETIFADYQSYGFSATTAAPTTAAVLTASGLIATAATGQSTPITLSQNVSLAAKPNATGSTAAIIAEHKRGDKRYYVQTDLSATYQKAKPTTAMALPTATTGGAAPTGGYAAM